MCWLSYIYAHFENCSAHIYGLLQINLCKYILVICTHSDTNTQYTNEKDMKKIKRKASTTKKNYLLIWLLFMWCAAEEHICRFHFEWIRELEFADIAPLAARSFDGVVCAYLILFFFLFTLHTLRFSLPMAKQFVCGASLLSKLSRMSVLLSNKLWTARIGKEIQIWGWALVREKKNDGKHKRYIYIMHHKLCIFTEGKHTISMWKEICPRDGY